MKPKNNVWWWGFLVGKVMIPVLLLISLPLITFFFTNKKMSKEAVIFFFGDQKAPFIETLVTSLRFNLNYIFSIIIVISLLNFFKKRNSGKVFNSNGNVYYNYIYFVFWVAATLLGYDKIQIAGIPIHMQYKLVLSGIFSDVLPDIYDDHYDSDETCEASIEKENFDYVNECDSVNLLIIDTYNIKMSELSQENQTYPTIIVRGNSIDGVRKVNKSLILNTKKAMDEIQRSEFKNVFVSSTSNPKNSINIINSSFRFFGRSRRFKLYVMQKDHASNGKYSKKYRIFI